MDKKQIKNMRMKLPDLLNAFIERGRIDEILESMGLCHHAELLPFLNAEEFPTEEQLHGFCNHFKLRYYTIKTWNVLHLTNLEE